MPGRFSRPRAPMAKLWQAGTLSVAKELDRILARMSDAISILQGSPSDPEDVALGGTADPGSDPSPALGDHVHALPAAAPAYPTQKTASEGSATTALRSDAGIAQGIVTTKGDILAHDGTTAERLPVGTNGYHLESRSTETTGLKWVVNSVPTSSVASKAFADTPYSAPVTVDVVLVDASGGAVTVNLPTAASAAGHAITIKKTDASANAVTIDGDGAETIDGSATQALSAQWQAVTIIAFGGSWSILSFNV